jgi:hypothetical protein
MAAKPNVCRAKDTLSAAGDHINSIRILIDLLPPRRPWSAQ